MAAGKNLRIMLGPSEGDLNIFFDFKKPADPACHYTEWGEEGRIVYVQVHRQARVCSAPDPKTGHKDLRRFLTTDLLLARALANTAIHELGHFIAFLDEEYQNVGNYMCTGNPPVKDRTLRKKREYYAGHQTFREDQKRQLIEQLRAGVWLGDLGVIMKPLH